MRWFKKNISEPVWMIAKSLDNQDEWGVSAGYLKERLIHKATGLTLNINHNSYQLSTTDFRLTDEEETLLFNKCLAYKAEQQAIQDKADREKIINKFKELEK